MWVHKITIIMGRKFPQKIPSFKLPTERRRERKVRKKKYMYLGSKTSHNKVKNKNEIIKMLLTMREIPIYFL